MKTIDIANAPLPIAKSLEPKIKRETINTDPDKEHEPE